MTSNIGVALQQTPPLHRSPSVVCQFRLWVNKKRHVACDQSFFVQGPQDLDFYDRERAPRAHQALDALYVDEAFKKYVKEYSGRLSYNLVV